MAEPDGQLVRRAQAGDGDALVALVRGQQNYVYSIAMSVMRNDADAADMTQEAFIRLLRSLHTFRGETKFTTWLYRLATNVCLDGLRRRGVSTEPMDPGDDDSAGVQIADDDRWLQPETSVETREQANEVRRALGNLPGPQRLALTLFYFEDMRYEDIAAVMDVPLNTVKSHIRRGKERLALVLRRPENGGEEVQWNAVR